jgi:SNW domain-containing protein 1
MASGMLLSRLPAPKNAPAPAYDAESDPWFQTHMEAVKPQAIAHFTPPAYGRRGGFMPRKAEHFGDGGAFPEIHVAQYPLDMGKEDEKVDSKILPVSVDAEGNIAFDAVVKQAENAKKTVFSQHRDLVPKVPSEVDTEKPALDEVKETTERTKAALEKIVVARLSAAQPKSVPNQSSAPSYIKYTPSQQSAAYNSGAKQRVIRMVDMPKDPLEPPKFKHKRVPKASGSPPVPVMHSPPRPVTVKDQQDWKIPPCISNWKNPKGYTIPLDKRLAADGRGLQEVQINDNFAKLSEALYVAEQKAREAVEMRSKIQRELMHKEKEKKEMELRMLAQRARMERAGVGAPPGAAGGGAVGGAERGTGGVPAFDRKMDEGEGVRTGGSKEERLKETKEERAERLQRESLREERRRERERERRLDSKEGPAGKKSKLTRDRDRDISEKMALGMANTGAGGGELTYDQRLFNQEKGMESGFAADDSYNVYDKGLFTSQSGLSGLYRPRKDSDAEVYGGGADEQLDKVLSTDRFRAGKGFGGATERAGPRDRPVEFEKDNVGEDPFGLDQFLTEVKKGKKALDRVGEGGTMRASTGSGNKDSYAGGSNRSRVDFQRGGQM